MNKMTDITTLKPGTVLETTAGIPVLTRTDAGWVHATLGVEIPADRVEGYLASGDVHVVEQAQPEISEMSMEEYQAYLDALPEETKLSLDTVQGLVVLEKQDGHWLTDGEENKALVDSLFFLKERLAVAEPDAAPETSWEGTAADGSPVKVIDEDGVADLDEEDDTLDENPAVEEEVAAVDGEVEQSRELFEHLESASEGETVRYASKHDGQGVISLTKQESGAWLSHSGGVYSSFLLSHVAPQLSFASESEEKIHLGKRDYTHSDLKIALTALEEHSGFQLTYALKPIDSPILQEDLKLLAQEYAPDIGPKAAIMGLLRDKLGLTREEELDDSPVIRLSQDIEFTQKQIAHAVEVLENYDGKLFVNELKLAGSPIGEVDPHALTGFIKDKIEGKKAFITVLKNAL